MTNLTVNNLTPAVLNAPKLEIFLGCMGDGQEINWIQSTVINNFSCCIYSALLYCNKQCFDVIPLFF